MNTMKFEFEHHHHIHAENSVITLLRGIMATQAELAADLTALKDQAAKAKAEILAKVAELEAVIAAGGGTTAEVDAALAALKAEVQGIDDLNADAATPA